MPIAPHQNIYVITGKVQEGKTSHLTRLVERLKKEDLKIIGFCSLVFFDKGERAGYILENLENGTQIPLATIEEKPGWVKFRRFYFNPLALEQGEHWIRKGIAKQPDLVVIDEVGPMELEGMGWLSVLTLLEKRNDIPQLWVVREQILPEIKEKWNVHDENIFQIGSIDPENRNRSLYSLIKDNKRNKDQGNDAIH